jgi:hypothetical protein
MRRTWLRFLVAVAVVLALGSIVGCAPRFVPVTSVPPDQGLVYIFRPGSPLGAAILYTVTANGVPVVRLRNGGYYPYVTPPGQVVFSAQTETSSSVAINVAPGGTYYLRGMLMMGAFVGRPMLEELPAAVGASEIARCRLQGGR